ncbi:hypothetical protein G6F35_013244 [Rhizopus arrhizus]|nr:hypothetical protein G6F35_013244 [Rhizopus arrhizus]
MINLSSAAGHLGFAGRSVYSASKWAVIGFTKSLAIELGPHGIRVNAILPGAVEGPRIRAVIAAKADTLGRPVDEIAAHRPQRHGPGHRGGWLHAEALLMGTGSPARCAAIIGTGLIGQGWAIVFARKGWDVRLYDVNAAMLAEARFDVVARIAALAAERGVDAVLVAGDVFDTQGVSDRTIRRLFAAMAAYAGPWVMIAGNHDAALADSVWSRAMQLGCIPGNVHVPLRTGVVDLPAINLAVLAAPLTQRHTYDDVTQAFDTLETEPGRVRVGLAHGSIGRAHV